MAPNLAENLACLSRPGRHVFLWAPHLSLWLPGTTGGTLARYAFDPDAGFSLASTAAARAWVDDGGEPYVFDHPRLVSGPVGDRLIRNGDWLIWPVEDAGFVYDLSVRRQEPSESEESAP